MQRSLLIASLLFSTIACYSQSKDIVGSWIWLDSVNTIQYFIKANGTIEERYAFSKEDIWKKIPITGTYKFKKDHLLTIKWANESVQIVNVKFIDNFTAEMQTLNRKDGPGDKYVFKKIIDEEVIPDK
ncbi:MAG: hypothetical protein IPP81_18685 [Chitinophagaceae bacterium]|nr:hypothetical protein [Chitinophagaceae bacterium]